MDKKEVILKILSSYEEITVMDQQDEDGIVFFKIKEKEYGCFYLMAGQESQNPYILVKNDFKYDYPHILPISIPIDKNISDKYRFVCLDENDSTIPFLLSFEEKIVDVIEKLLHLLSLSSIEKEEEFQKEFLFYWNQAAKNRQVCSLFIGKERKYQKLKIYKSSYGEFRFVADEIYLNDANDKINGQKKWEYLSKLPAFYIPITDKRRVVPPTKDRNWRSDDIINIICGKQFSRISHESYVELGQEKIRGKYIFLVFGMVINGNCIDFVSLIEFKNKTNGILLNKLKKEIINVTPIVSKRKDYYHLCKQIGNSITLLNKNILLIGAGSLGSYVAKELVKTGAKKITIYDDELLEEDNILRHMLGDYFVNFSKVIGLKYEMEKIHPEIQVNAISKKMDKNILEKEMEKADLIIFTVGSSAVQWDLNKVLKEKNCNAKVIYVWLEAGGVNSHILSIDYNKKGCFQCLFTDENGNLVNNKVNIVTEDTIDSYKIRNGCGGTRVAYGNAVLLRTTAILLDVIKNEFERPKVINQLINITPKKIIDAKDTFVEKKCRCCGNDNIK